MKLVVAVALCATMIALVMVVIIVPTALSGHRRAKERAQIESDALHTSAVQSIQSKVDRLLDAAGLWIDVLERGGGMDIPASFATLLSVQWSILSGNPAVEQVTFGASSNEGIAMDTPASLDAADGFPATSTVLKVKINGAADADCRTSWVWDARTPRINVNNMTQTYRKVECSYTYPRRGWYRFHENRSHYPALAGKMVTTELEPNFRGEYVVGAIGRKVFADAPTSRNGTQEGVAVVDFSTRAIAAAFSSTQMSPRGQMLLFAAGTKRVIGLAPFTESVALLANASDPASDVIGLKEIRHLTATPLIHDLDGALSPILLSTDNVAAKRSTTIKAGGLNVIVNYVDIYALEGTLHWRVVALTPEEDFTDEVTDERNMLLAISIVLAVLLIAGQCLFMSFAIARPLAVVADSMELAVDLHDTSDVAPDAAISEIRSIQQSFVSMTKQLVQLRTYMPAAVLARLDQNADPDEADDDDMEASIVKDTSTNRGSSAGRSSRSRRSRRTNESSIGGGMAHAELGGGSGTPLSAMACAVENRVAGTIAIVNIRKFAAHSNTQLVKLHAKLTTAVQEAVRDTRGVLDAFHGDHFQVSFNCAAPAAAPSVKAAAFVNALHAAVWAADGPQHAISVGLATSRVAVGFLGNASVRRFSTVGACFAQATALERHCARLQNELGLADDGRAGALFALANARVVSEAASMHRMLAVSFVDSKPERKVAFAYLGPKERQQPSADGADGEWLYVMGDDASKDPVTLVNEAAIDCAAQKILPEKVAAALDILNGLAQSSSTGASTARVIEAAKHALEDELHAHHAGADDAAPAEQDHATRADA